MAGLTSTGTWNSSDRSKANLIISLASSGLPGSSTGTLASLAMSLESCSVWDEWGPGSSQEIMTSPPILPI